jgi:hypothetical protein
MLGIILAILAFVIFSIIVMWNAMGVETYSSLGKDFWKNIVYGTLSVAKLLRSAFLYVSAFLLLQGLSKAIRYLLALEAEIRSNGAEYPS